MQTTDRPHLDEHDTHIGARAGDVWPVLVATLDQACSRRAMGTYARAVGCVDRTAAGPRPLIQGSTVPGFRVAAVTPGSELVLEGRHRFSTYALIFRLESTSSDRSRLRAESRARFPGLAGGVYRLLVVSTGAHRSAMRRMLATIRRRSEASRDYRSCNVEHLPGRTHGVVPTACPSHWTLGGR